MKIASRGLLPFPDTLLCLLGIRQAREENDRYNNSSAVVWAKLLRVFQNYPIYATTPREPQIIAKILRNDRHHSDKKAA